MNKIETKYLPWGGVGSCWAWTGGDEYSERKSWVAFLPVATKLESK